MTMEIYRHLRVNSRGSWTNVLSFPIERQKQIKDACETLVIASQGKVSFKIVDDKGVTCAALDARREPVGWFDRD